MKKIKPDGSKTLYVGGIYEVDKTSGGSVTRTVTYYPVAGAMRINSTLYYVLKDHLGSASVVTNASGTILGENRYYPFGETRLTTGTIFTDKLFTGQREMAGLGIYHYGARFYSPKLGRFLSPDSIVPGYANPQAFNRYAYVLNNPLRYIDPTGHDPVCGNSNSDPECNGPDPWVPTTPSAPAPYVPLEPGLPQGGGGGGGGGGGNNNNNNGNNDGPDPVDGESEEPNLGGGQPLLSPNPDDIIGCSLFDCALSGVSLIATVVAAVPGTIGLVGLGVDLVATFWAIGRTNDDYRQGEISKTRQYALNTTGLVGLLPGSLLGGWAFPVSFVAGLANLLMTATGLPN